MNRLVSMGMQIEFETASAEITTPAMRVDVLRFRETEPGRWFLILERVTGSRWKHVTPPGCIDIIFPRSYSAAAVMGFATHPMLLALLRKLVETRRELNFQSSPNGWGWEIQHLNRLQALISDTPTAGCGPFTVNAADKWRDEPEAAAAGQPEGEGN